MTRKTGQQNRDHKIQNWTYCIQEGSLVTIVLQMSVGRIDYLTKGFQETTETCKKIRFISNSCPIQNKFQKIKDLNMKIL